MSPNSAADLTTSQLAFLIADIIGFPGGAKFTQVDWADLGPAADAVKQAIGDQNIDLDDPDVSVEISAIKYGKASAGIVDVSYDGGGKAPDPFRFVHFVVGGKYIGYAGEVAS